MSRPRGRSSAVKRCAACKTIKPVKEYYLDPARTHGAVEAVCVECQERGAESAPAPVEPKQETTEMPDDRARTIERNLNYEGVRVCNNIVEAELTTSVKARLLADLIVFAQTRLEQTLAEPNEEYQRAIEQASARSQVNPVNPPAPKKTMTIGRVKPAPIEDDLSFLT